MIVAKLSEAAASGFGRIPQEISLNRKNSINSQMGLRAKQSEAVPMFAIF